MNIIHQHKATINCNQEALGHQIKDEIGSLFESHFYPKLQALFSEFDVQDSIWQIDRLDVLLPDLRANNWKEELIDKSLYQIRQFLESHKPGAQPESHSEVEPNQLKKMSKKQHIEDLFLNYLKSGTLATNAAVVTMDQLFGKLEFDEGFNKKLEEKLRHNYDHILRWSLNVPRPLKMAFLKQKGISHDLDFSKDASDKSKHFENLLEFLLWVKLFYKNTSNSSAPDFTDLWKLSKRYFEVEDVNFDKLMFMSKLSRKPVKNEKKAKQLEVSYEALFINNAGLILLHPFIVPLFKSLNFLDQNDQWVNFITQNRGVLILQYLITLNTSIYENDLVLNKLLCGIPISDPLNTEWSITNKEKKQCKKLLNTVIAHWSILKKTSIMGLQESFLQRDAKIEKLASGKYEITVEQKSIDLLLDHLPWGIGMIKTPWMEQPLVCNWN